MCQEILFLPSFLLETDKSKMATGKFKKKLGKYRVLGGFVVDFFLSSSYLEHECLTRVVYDC